jgi:hypothetical protein
LGGAKGPFTEQNGEHEDQADNGHTPAHDDWPQWRAICCTSDTEARRYGGPARHKDAEGGEPVSVFNGHARSLAIFGFVTSLITLKCIATEVFCSVPIGTPSSTASHQCGNCSEQPCAPARQGNATPDAKMPPPRTGEGHLFGWARRGRGEVGRGERAA